MVEWRHVIDVKQYLKDGTEASAAAAGVLKEIAKLQRKEEFKDDSELDQIREEFQSLADDPETTDESFNDVLDRLYDWANGERVWCGL